MKDMETDILNYINCEDFENAHTLTNLYKKSEAFIPTSNFYLLEATTYTALSKYDKALESIQNGLALEPNHYESNYKAHW